METIYDRLKDRICKKGNENCIKVLSIEKINIHTEEAYRLRYITKKQFSTSAPRFNFESDIFTIESLKSDMRDIKIEELLNSITYDFDVEEYIYTDEQREKLHNLRNNKREIGCMDALKSIRKEYSDTFKIDQHVWYNNNPGKITFRHADKDENDITRWTVKVKDTEFRYVNGTDLLDRKISDLSNIPIDPELNKLSTEKLLTIYRKHRDRNKGVGRLDIKRILQDREHIRRDVDKIILIK